MSDKNLKKEDEEHIPQLRKGKPDSQPKIKIDRDSVSINPFKIVPPTPVSNVKKTSNLFEKTNPRNTLGNRSGSIVAGWFGNINLGADVEESDDETDRESMDFDRESADMIRKKYQPPKTPGATNNESSEKKTSTDEEEEDEDNKKKETPDDNISYMINPGFSLGGDDEKKKKKLEKIKSLRKGQKQPIWYNHILTKIHQTGNSTYGWYLTIMVYLWEIFEIQRGYIGKIVSVYMSVMVFFSLIGFYVWTDKILVAYNEWLFYIVFVCQIIASVSFTLDYLIRLLSCVADKKYTVWGEFFGRVYFLFTWNSLLDLFTLMFAVSLVIQITVRLTFQYPIDIVSSRDWFLTVSVVLPNFRVLRLVRVERYANTLAIFRKVLYDKASELLTALSVMVSTIFIVATIMYYLERDLQPDKLSTLFDSTYFTVITLSTIGYGDISPISRTGKMVTMIAAIVAIALFTIPTSIIGSALIEQLQEESRKQLEKIKDSQKKIGQKLKEFKQSEEQTLAAKMMGADSHQNTPQITGVSQSNNCPHCGKEISFVTQIGETTKKHEEEDLPGDSIFEFFRKSRDGPSHKRTVSNQGGKRPGHKRTISNQLDFEKTAPKRSLEIPKFPEPVKRAEKGNRKISFDPKNSNFK